MSETTQTPPLFDSLLRTCGAHDADAVGVTSGDGVVLIADVYGPRREERAAFIVRAANSHHDLVKAATPVCDAGSGLDAVPDAHAATVTVSVTLAEIRRLQRAVATAEGRP